MYWLLAGCFIVLFLCFDVYYSFWVVLVIIKSFLCNLTGGLLDIFGTVTTWGVCTTTDLDFMCHMNNARYLRNADNVRFEFFIRTGIHKAIKQTGGYFVAGASTIRFRREIKPFETYRIHCKLLCWDENAFYVEQTYERCRDNFICAILLIKMRLVKTTTAAVLKELSGKDIPSPRFPDEVTSWIESNEISSKNLRKAQ